MFGYVVANRKIMTEEQLARYKGCYCGLCRALKSRCGSLSRVTLTYDMTFLILFLSSMYEHDESSGEERCVMHPSKPHDWWATEVTDYAADMNLALAYLNFLDDWNDERKLLKLTGAGLMKENYAAISRRYPEKCGAVEKALSELSEIEKRREPDPDAGARCFGGIMAEVFDYKLDSYWGPAVREFGQALGEFVYIMDAVCDLKKDRRKAQYNAMLALSEAGCGQEDMRGILTMLIGECTRVFDRLPIVKDADIIRNVLYSGVWLRYNALLDKKTGEGDSEQ